MKFNGTKGKWVLNEKYQIIEDSEGYGIAQQNGIKNSKKWLNDALIISKAPEMLDMIEELIYQFESNNNSSQETDLLNEAKQLIKQATEL